MALQILKTSMVAWGFRMGKLYYLFPKQRNDFIVTTNVDSQDMTTQSRHKTLDVSLM